MMHVNKYGKGSQYYGQLMTESLPSEVKRIWYSRDDELPDLPQHKWSWELEDDLEQVERRDLLIKILTDAPLSDRHALVVELVVIQEFTLAEVGLRIGLTKERVRQMYLQAMRKLRRHQFQITQVQAYELDCEVTTWRQWKWSK